MNHSCSSIDLLAHFDRPKKLVLATAPPSAQTALAPTRGIRWVLKWSAAMVSLSIAASIVTEFTYTLAAEHRLNTAARAAVSEAMLPRATEDSVRAAARRRLDNRSVQHLQVTTLQNGHSVQGQIRHNDGDRFAATVSLPSSDVVPWWVRLLNPAANPTTIVAHAEKQVPGRKLAYRSPIQTAAE